MRIVNVIQCTNLGGMEQASLRLMCGLKSSGHDLELISLNPQGALKPLLEQAGIPAVSLDYRAETKFAAAWAVHKALSAMRPEAIIVTGHNFAASLGLGNLCRPRRIMAMHYHHEGVMPNWQWRLLYFAARRQFRAVTFPSDFVRREAETIYPPIADISWTVRNPVSPPSGPNESVRANFRAGLDIAADAPVVGNAGWLIHRKRFDVFLYTAAEVLKRRRDTFFVIAGDGEQRTVLERLAVRIGIADSIKWLGWQSDLSAFYSGIDVLLFNSDWDAFPTTPIEAMTYGRPVVASVENGGLREVLTPETGWLLNIHDPQQLASEVVAALGPEGARRGAKARAQVLDMGDSARIVKEVERYLCV